MQAVVARLPELDGGRSHPETAPERRQRHLVFVQLAFHLLHLGVQQGTRGDDLALRRGPGADLAAARARGEIACRLGKGHPLRLAGDLHLPAQRKPRKRQCHLRIMCNMPRLAALVVGEEHEAAFVVGLQQHGPHPGLAVLVERGHAHGIRLGYARLDGQCETLLELHVRVRGHVRPLQAGCHPLVPDFFCARFHGSVTAAPVS